MSATRSLATILVVDDEPRLVSVVRAYLEREGYRVVAAADGRAALDAFQRERPDLVVLDLLLPGVDGLEVCRRLRRESDVPIVMLTARAEEVDELVGLELGADDYVTKPFSPRALVARVRAVLRRAGGSAEKEDEAPLVVGPLRVDEAGHEASWDGTPLSLTPTEFRLLAALARRPGRVFERSELLRHAQGDEAAAYADPAYERTIDAHVKNLRKKLAEAGGERAAAAVATVPGVGYKAEQPAGA